MVGAAFGLRHDVVNGHIAEGKSHPTAGADSLLPAKELMLMGLVGGELAEVGPAGNVRPMVQLKE